MHEDHVGCPGFVDFAPDALCIKPTRRACHLPALRETPLCKKAFNSGSAALVSALAALSEAASDFLVGTIFSFRVICNLSQARRVLLKTTESPNAKPLKCRVASCSGRSVAAQRGFGAGGVFGMMESHRRPSLREGKGRSERSKAWVKPEG